MSNSIFSQIDRVEPPFWWSNMNLSSVQIMFYGKNINQYDVSVNKDVIIENIQKTENPNYVFVTINTKNCPAQDLNFTFKNKPISQFLFDFFLGHVSSEKPKNPQGKFGFTD